MMILKFITITLITLCVAENKLLWPKHAGRPTMSAQRFNKHNVPLTFTYGEGHPYSSPKPVLGAGPVIPNMYQRIQYAPLHGRINQRTMNTAAEYSKMTPTLSSASAASTEPYFISAKGKNFYGKDHLEPRVPTGQSAPELFKCYSPVHNVEVLPSVSRSPGHNAVYRSYPDPIQRDKPFKVDYVRPYGVYENLEVLTSTMMPFKLPHENPIRPFSIPNPHYVLNPNAVEPEGPVVDKIKRQYSPYAKFHRLHLNIARVYSPGQVPQKSPVFADTYTNNFGRLPVHSQAYLSPIYQALPEQKTMLYPIKEDQNKYRFRLP